MILIYIGLFIYLIFSNRSLSWRLGVIEKKLKQGANVYPGPAVAPVVQKVQPASGILDRMSEPVPALNLNQSPVPAEEAGPSKFTTWLKEDWLMKLGALLFILGFGWFVSYAFANNWVGPVGRISIGIVAGIIIMTFGFRWMMKYAAQGAVFMALGAGMAILTIFAGRSIYGFFTPISAVAFDFIIVAFISYASYKFNMKTLAFIAQILAFAAPLLVAGQTDTMLLFSYLLVVSLSTLFLAGVTGWRELITSSLIFVGFYSLPYIFGMSSTYSNDASFVLNFAYVFSMLYLVSGMAAVIRQGAKDAKNEIILALLNGLFLFSWVYFVSPKEWTVSIFAFWAIIYSVTSFMAFRYSMSRAPFYAYGAVAVSFIAAATAMQLDGAILTIAFTVEILLLVLSILMLTNDTRAALFASWLFVAPIFLSFASMTDYSRSTELFTEDFFALLLLGASLIFVGRLIISACKPDPDKIEAQEGGVILVIGTFYIGYIIWEFVHILMSYNPDMATLSTLMIYTVLGLIAYFNGLYTGDMPRRTYGGLLLAFVVGRLILIDVWDMELFGRVVTFLSIGVLLMSTAFLTKKKKHEKDVILSA